MKNRKYILLCIIAIIFSIYKIYYALTIGVIRSIRGTLTISYANDPFGFIFVLMEYVFLAICAIAFILLATRENCVAKFLGKIFTKK